MSCDSWGFVSFGHLERPGSITVGSGSRPRAVSHSFIAGRLSRRKWAGMWRMNDAALMEMARRPARSNVGCRGPPPSVVRRNRSGSNFLAVAPCPLR